MFHKLLGLEKKTSEASEGRGLHCEGRRGTAVQAADYCKKDGDWTERGIISKSEQGKRTDLTAVQAALEGDAPMRTVMKEHFTTYMRYGRMMEKYRAAQSKERSEHTVCLVMYGASDSGKTTFVQTHWPSAYWWTKTNNSTWFDKYDGEEVVVFDEFKGSIPLSLFKRLIDKTPLLVETKGGGVNISPKLVIFLSNYAPEDWYEFKNAHDRTAFERRIHIVLEAQEIVHQPTPGSVLGQQKIGTKAVLKKMFLPHKAAMPAEWNLPGLTCEESKVLLEWTTPQAEIAILQQKIAYGKICSGSGGVILDPLLPELSDFPTMAKEFLTFCYSKHTISMPPAPMEEEGVIQPAVEVDQQTDSTENLPSRKRLPREKKVSKAKRYKNKYIADEAECSDLDSNDSD